MRSRRGAGGRGGGRRGDGGRGFTPRANPGASKVLAEAGKKFENLTVKMGYLSGKRIEASDLEALSKLPSIDALRGQLLSVFNAPATKFVGVLAAGPRDLVGVLNARTQALGEAA